MGRTSLGISTGCTGIGSERSGFAIRVVGIGMVTEEGVVGGAIAGPRGLSTGASADKLLFVESGGDSHPASKSRRMLSSRQMIADFCIIPRGFFCRLIQTLIFLGRSLVLSG